MRAPDADTGSAAKIAAELGLTENTAKLLCMRGYDTPEKASAFLHMEDEQLYDPFLLADMQKAVDRIHAALQKNEKIVVYGDYDVDGVTSVSTLLLYLRGEGADAGYYIPNRIGEGYGMSSAVIEKLAADGVQLIITVDTGITAREEIETADRLGIDVIVTDHHECHEECPPAVAVINPMRADSQYPFPGLAGVGVVFKLVCALEITKMNGKEEKIDSVRRICTAYADLIALGTIADVMPIISENRLIVAYGLHMIEKRARTGVSALIDASAYKNDARPVSPGRAYAPKTPRINSSFVGYTLAPKINAAGRISSASIAVELFLTQSREKADELAEKLCEINRFRQSEENKIAEEAYEKIESEHDFENDPFIVIADDHWHHGVIGIVASRITEKYGLPSILVSFDGEQNSGVLDTDIGKGSGRSVKGLNLVDALVYCSDLLVKFGGHKLAAGLSIQRGQLDAFRDKINEYTRERFRDDGVLRLSIDYDFELAADTLDLRFAEELRLMEPCGTQNPTPVFVMRSCTVDDVIPVKGGKHTKLIVSSGGRPIVAMYYAHSPASINLYRGESADLLFNVEINEFGGNRTVQLNLRDIMPSGESARQATELCRRYEEIKNGAVISTEENAVPCRSDFSAVYKMLLREIRMGNDTISHRALLAKLADADEPIGYIKLKFIVAVMRELNIIGIEEAEDEVYSLRVNYTNVKTDLEKSNILRRLRSQLKK